MSVARYRIGVDTGGTFCDFVQLDESSGRVEVWKVPSTPADPAEAIGSGLARSEGPPASFFAHGTTVGTNALLEGKGARAGLAVTAGFRGIYEVQEQARPYGPSTFDMFYRRPDLLVPPDRTVEVPERVGSRGEVLRGLDEAAVREALRGLRRRDLQSLAVCLLFSFLHPEHERAVAAIAAEELPECAVSLSCEVLPQIREYYRLSTTVINAYLEPVLRTYLERLGRRLDGLGLPDRQRYVMQSNGGMVRLDGAARRAASSVLSGPAGGVTAGVGIGRQAGFPDLITFDMGGTSCDVALVAGGSPEVRNRSEVGGRHIALPSLAIDTVSAGGGTIARVDAAGLLQVGPDSAGADPGPACYGRGGREPTVTDADLALGYLSPAGLLGGRLPLDRERALAALAERLARPLGLDVWAAARGVVRLIDVKMGEALKAISTGRGFDLRAFTLIAFGGAGPVHAPRIAAELGIPRVLVPPHPGVTSALGLLMADVRHDYVLSHLDPLEGLEPADAAARLAALEERARRELAEEGFAPEEIECVPALDLRYEGQGYELTVGLGGGAAPARLDAAGLRAIRERFDDLHQERFGHKAPSAAAEVVSYRLAGLGRVRAPELARRPRGRGGADGARTGDRAALFADWAGLRPVPVYAREGLSPGHRLAGPAIVEQDDSTVVVEPGQEAAVDDWGNLLITPGAGR
jgi:N-methylhydantoinase A